MSDVNGSTVQSPVTSGAVSDRAALLAQINALKKQIADAQKAERAAKRKARPLEFKVGEKGGLSVSGLDSKFPTTLYASQWMKLLKGAEEIKAALLTNFDRLKMQSVEQAAEIDTWLGRTRELDRPAGEGEEN